MKKNKFKSIFFKGSFNGKIVEIRKKNDEVYLSNKKNGKNISIKKQSDFKLCDFFNCWITF